MITKIFKTLAILSPDARLNPDTAKVQKALGFDLYSLEMKWFFITTVEFFWLNVVIKVTFLTV